MLPFYGLGQAMNALEAAILMLLVVYAVVMWVVAYRDKL